MQIGVVGLGVMGRNMAHRLMEAGHEPVAFDPWPEARLTAAELRQVGSWRNLVQALAPPRRLLLMVKAGEPVDAALEALLPLLSSGDVLIDGGNSYWRDSERRQRSLEAKGVSLLGCGISGGREGARHGACLMAGGNDLAWTLAAPALMALAADGPDGPACRHVGPDGAGHFVKMVHNGIEYAVMEAIAEADSLLAAEGLAQAARAAWFAGQSDGLAGGFLQEITAEVLGTEDSETGEPMVSLIEDVAEQKGTGGWTVGAALELGAPLPMIAEAVFLRSLSGHGELRGHLPDGERTLSLENADLAAALSGAVAMAFHEGFFLLQKASEAWAWQLDLSSIARLWQAGSILRCRWLQPFAEALEAAAESGGLAQEELRGTLQATLPGWRRCVAAGAAAGLPLPVLSAGLSALEARARETLPTQLIQAQRDRFGDHGFARRDREGRHHGPWYGGDGGEME